MGLFLAVAARESYRPERPLRNPLVRRWAGHFSLYAAGLMLVALTGPSDLAVALFGGDRAWFLFASLGQAGGWVELVAGVLLLDLLMYAVHRAEHTVFLFWRFHAVHHADTDLDVTTAIRHHPVEFVVNSFILAFVLFGLGGPGWLIPIYGLMFLSSSLLQHMNSALPARLEWLLGQVLVTPDMHRVHHSVLSQHHEANFGAVFSIWDRLFGTYRRLDPAQHEALGFGIPAFTEPRFARLRWVWLLPFVLRRSPAVRSAERIAGPSGATRAEH